MRECDANGVTSMILSDGSMIGPPADIEYAVDPVAVAMITPSDSKGGVVRIT